MKTQPYSPWLHRYAIFVAVCTFILIIAGALVTSNDAGLSVPDWPTSFGSFRMPRMVGGVMFEHGHRMIAGTVGILTIILALAIWIRDSRRWAKWVAGGAVLAVLAQAALGGITVLFYLPVAISTSHATLGQIFFCLAASLAVFTRAGWRWDEPKLEDTSAPSLRLLTVVTTGIILVQLVIGAVYRHSGKGLDLHIAGAGVVTMFVAYLVTRILIKFSQTPQLLRPALLLGGMLVVQVSLGIASYVVKMAERNAPQPLPPVVNTTTAHVAVGALVLLTSLYMTYQTHRYLTPQAEETKVVSAPHGAAV
ncbi:MAG: COX15/CtaA family protein [Terriglobia bacterium]|jgi:cytochrome c oxidase assembly protein subunit 15